MIYGRIIYLGSFYYVNIFTMLSYNQLLVNGHIKE